MGPGQTRDKNGYVTCRACLAQEPAPPVQYDPIIHSVVGLLACSLVFLLFL